MAPSKRPLFDPPPPATLDDFFRKPKSSNNRSASSQVQKRVKARHELSSQHRPRTKWVKPPGAEIIVLDSDDDTPLARTGRKAEDNPGCSSDVEVVEAVTQRTHDAPSSGKQVKAESRHELDDFGSQDLLTFTQHEASESDKLQLFGPAEDDVSHSTGDQDFRAASSIRLDHLLAAPTPLTEDPGNSHSPSSDIQGDSSGVLRTSVTQPDPANVIEIDDEWGTGDDELAQANGAGVEDVLELTDDEVEEVLKPGDGSPVTPGETIDQCPVCGISLTSFSSLVSTLA